MTSFALRVALLATALITSAEAQQFTIVDAPGAGKKSGHRLAGVGHQCGRHGRGILSRQKIELSRVRARAGWDLQHFPGGKLRYRTPSDQFRGRRYGEHVRHQTITSLAFILNANGKITTFDPRHSNIVYANAINNSNAIAGTFYNPSIKPIAFIWRKKAKLVTFQAPGAFGTEASSINDSNTIAGTCSAARISRVAIY